MTMTTEQKQTDQENFEDLNDPRLFINRELSMLEFQRRVLEEALDETNPLLERVKFLAILGSNLDEFFMLRVSGLKKQVDAGVVNLPPDGMPPAEQIAAIRKSTLQLIAQARDCLRNDLLPRLNQSGIHVLDYAELDEKQKGHVKSYFDEVIFPVLTPAESVRHSRPGLRRAGRKTKGTCQKLLRRSDLSGADPACL